MSKNKFNSLHSPKESTITKSIMTYLKNLPGIAWKQAGGMYGTAGLPDVFYVRKREHAVRIDEPPGVYVLRFAEVFAFEVKRAGGKPTAIQQQMMDRLQAAGVKCFVVHSKDQVKKIVE